MSISSIAFFFAPLIVESVLSSSVPIAEVLEVPISPIASTLALFIVPLAKLPSLSAFPMALSLAVFIEFVASTLALFIEPSAGLLASPIARFFAAVIEFGVGLSPLLGSFSIPIA